MAQGLAHFPGVNQVLGASISFVHGISPAVATLTIVPQQNFIGEGGALVFTFDKTAIIFFDCRIDFNSFQRDRNGEIWRLSIFDRRWKWSMGNISGAYNLRTSDGKIKPSTEKTPQELAQFCLSAIDERGFDVGDLPNDARPEVNWDYAVPMEALANLCDDLGCRVVLGLDNKVVIHKAGKGKQLPDDGMIENSLTIDPPEKPDRIAVLCGPDWLQWDFALEAVGQDTDGTLKPIDDLSYKPAGYNWGDGGNLEFPAIADEKSRKLAVKTVFRSYRIVTNFFLELEPIEIIARLDQILPIDTVQCETITENGVTKNLPALVYGKWWYYIDVPLPENFDNTTAILTPAKNYDDATVIAGGYSIDTKRGVVNFGQPIFKNGQAATTSILDRPAELYLRTRFHVRDVVTLGLRRYNKERILGGRFNTPTKYFRHDELTLRIVPVFDDNFQLTREITNREEVDKEAEKLLDAIERDYDRGAAETRKYLGLRKIELDGAIHQITFQVGRSGATTTVARNDTLVGTTPHKRRRQLERLRSVSRARLEAIEEQPLPWWIENAGLGEMV